MTSATGSDAGEAGFTLLELIAVVFIIALVLGISYPSMSRGSSALHLRTASRDLVNTFRFAREKAVSEQESLQLVIDRKGRKVVLADVLGTPLRTYTLPEDVRIKEMSRAGVEVGEDAMTVRFLPSGGLESAGIRLEADGGSMMQVVADPLSGGARMEPVYE
ncbi:MAG: GspH/FimT family pseudopilin [Acidobacteriota bacterium]|jgi:prepilin-type N-terminal cleavage/methylation domain-containing protein|nr:GspH/FimT family pseudopilin [Acidobacteriota bacterium]